MRYLEIKNKIQKYYTDLPKNQKKVADFIIENFDHIPFQNVQNVSKSTSASVATIVRFAQRIGFSGFSEMREQIAENLKNHIQSKEIFSLVNKEELAGDTLTAVANQDIKNINDSLHLIERKNFNLATNMLLKANRVYTIGLGISNLLAQILAYQLSQVGIDSVSFRHDSAYFQEQLIYATKEDVLVAFSFPPYSKETIETAKLAKKMNIKVVSITNRSASPITLYSSVSLCVQSENMLFTNSFAAISVLINALSTECAVRDKKRAEETLELMNDISDKLNQTIT